MQVGLTSDFNSMHKILPFPSSSFNTELSHADGHVIATPALPREI